MAALQIRREESGGIVTLHLAGTFDGRTAHQLHRFLKDVDGQQVVVDFSQVRSFSDAAVAVASEAMADRQVRLCGLDQHRERVFRYFGVAVPLEPQRAYWTAEDALLAG
jgi:anti-anti-sigma factor